MYFPRYISLGYVCLLFSLLNPTRVLFALHFGLEKDKTSGTIRSVCDWRQVSQLP
ncbi:MAG: hypothetical protein JWN60_490 [Acidobacteria bacterium]|nr:hypothetical protein [Acidobacteriota bacterium]